MAAQQLWQFPEVCSNPPRLVFGEQLGRRPLAIKESKTAIAS
jgi:hypothetical protein